MKRNLKSPYVKIMSLDWLYPFVKHFLNGLIGRPTEELERINMKSWLIKSFLKTNTIGSCWKCLWLLNDLWYSQNFVFILQKQWIFPPFFLVNIFPIFLMKPCCLCRALNCVNGCYCNVQLATCELDMNNNVVWTKGEMERTTLSSLSTSVKDYIQDLLPYQCFAWTKTMMLLDCVFNKTPALNSGKFYQTNCYSFCLHIYFVD